MKNKELNSNPHYVIGMISGIIKSNDMGFIKDKKTLKEIKKVLDGFHLIFDKKVDKILNGKNELLTEEEK